MSRNLSGPDLAWWHRRYLRQAEWTKPLRYLLYRRLEIARCQRILEVGCGTGAIAAELAARTTAQVHGLDVDPSSLRFFQHRPESQKILLTAGDAGALPFPDGTFDLVVTHYFWLWAGDAEGAARECHRVLRTGGVLASLAEPDYSKRIDVPGGNPSIGAFLSQDLKDKGADPDSGGKLNEIFSRVGLRTETGWVDDEVRFEDNPGIFVQEWELLSRLGYPPDQLAALQAEPKARMVMPVHWALGWKR